jgi:Pentapeptide repeats (8 copies)
MEVLTAFIREHSREPWPAPVEGREPERSMRPDVQAAVAVVARRDEKRDTDSIDLSGADLARARIIITDLRGANLLGTDLRGADLFIRTSAAPASLAWISPAARHRRMDDSPVPAVTGEPDRFRLATGLQIAWTHGSPAAARAAG